MPLASPRHLGVLPCAPMATDDDIVARLRAGDAAAFTDVVRRHQRAMRGVARYYCGDSPIADEVVQETWLAALEGLARFEGRSSLRTWLFRILANRARTRAVREGRTLPLSALSTDEGPAVDPTVFAADGHWNVAPRPWEADTPEAIVGRGRAVEGLWRALDALPERQRVVVTLRDVEGLDAEAVCELLGVTEANQRVLLHRGRAALRAALDAHLGGGRS